MSQAFQDLSAELLASGLRIRFRAKGQSMFPTIMDGEVIIIEPFDARAARRGDILLFCKGKGVIAHRVVKVERASGEVRRLIPRGETSAAADEAITPREVLGRVVAVERAGRTVALNGLRARLRRMVRRLSRARSGSTLGG